jgi:hypothetical protein
MKRLRDSFNEISARTAAIAAIRPEQKLLLAIIYSRGHDHSQSLVREAIALNLDVMEMVASHFLLDSSRRCPGLAKEVLADLWKCKEEEEEEEEEELERVINLNTGGPVCDMLESIEADKRYEYDMLQYQTDDEVAAQDAGILAAQQQYADWEEEEALENQQEQAALTEMEAIAAAAAAAAESEDAAALIAAEESATLAAQQQYAQWEEQQELERDINLNTGGPVCDMLESIGPCLL